ncbi:MAG: hypothetical protein Q9166_007690 [cf. Caloplaca sp. 2 TL-2023]
MAQCRDCLIQKNLYPTHAPDVITPVSAMSTSFCSSDGGRTNTKTIDGWMDGNTYSAGNVNRLEPITTIPTDGPTPNTGIGGSAVETVIAETVFDSIISAASTETGLVSAISSGTAATGQSVSTASSRPTPTTVSSAATTGGNNGGGPNTSLRTTSTSSMISDTTSSTTAPPAGGTGLGSPPSGSNDGVTLQLDIYVVASLLALMIVS